MNIPVENIVIADDNMQTSPTNSCDKLCVIRKRNYDNSMTKLAPFVSFFQMGCMVDFKGLTIKTKCPDDMFSVPTTADYRCLLSYKYKKDQLKTMAKHFSLRVAGTNGDLLTRIYTYMKMYGPTTTIQRYFRGHLRRRCNLFRGPGFLNRGLCSNGSDFLTGDEMVDIPSNQFISYTADDGYVYGFDVVSLYNLKTRVGRGENVLNPYTRSIIPACVFRQLRSLLRLSRSVYQNAIDIDIPSDDSEPVVRTMSDRVCHLFMDIDSHGHYTCHSWFMLLESRSLIRLLRELADIYGYRAMLTSEVRWQICPRDPFRRLFNTSGSLSLDTPVDALRESAMDVLETMVTSGVDEDSRALGVLYVLQALTLVSAGAREAMPWLYDAVAYNQIYD